MRFFDGFLPKPAQKKELFSVLKDFLKTTGDVRNTPDKPETSQKTAITLEKYSCGGYETLPCHKPGAIAEELETKFIGLWGEIKDQYVMFKIKKFIDRLDTYAKKHNIGFLLSYSCMLREDMDNLDLDCLKERLREFPQLISELREQ